MPQLAVGTYPSQIFWVLIGFTLVYLFISRVVTPALQEIMRNRSDYVESIVKSAEELQAEADQIEKDSQIALENAQLEISAREAELISDFREKSLAEKNAFYERSSKKYSDQTTVLTQVVNDVFASVSESSDKIVEKALKVISRGDHEH